MTKGTAGALGWAYGRIERALGDGYDAAGVKYGQAIMRPIEGLARIHRAAMMENRIAGDIIGDLAGALDEVDLTDTGEGPEAVQPLSMRGIWHTGYLNGRNGVAYKG